MKNNLIIFFLLLFACAATAQRTDNIISLKEQRFQCYLEGYKIIRVIDARKDKSNIGFMLTGLKKEVKNKIVFSSLLTHEFENLVDIDTFPLTNRTELILRINDVLIQELTKKKWASVKLSVSFIEKKGEIYNELFTATEVELYNIFLAERAKQYAESIGEVFTRSINSFILRLKNAQFKPHEITIDKLFEAPLLDSLMYPNLENQQPCVFQQFYDYRDNTPDTTSDFSIKYTKVDTKNKVEATVSSEKRDTKPWGFYNGKHLFIKSGKKYYPLQKVNQDLVFYEKHSELKGMDEKDFLISAGFAIATAALTGGSFILIYTMNMETVEIPLSLNKQSGTLEVSKDTTTAPKSTSLYIFNHSFSDKELDVFVDNQKISCLPRGSYAIVTLDKITTNAQVCVQVKGENSTCENIPLIEGKRNYILTKAKKNKRTSIAYDLDKSDLKDLKNGIENGMYDLMNYY